MLGLLKSICSDNDERYGITHISDHESKEQRKEDRNEERRVDLLIFRERHKTGCILIFTNDPTIILFDRNILETRLLGFGFFYLSSTGLFKFNVNIIPKLLLKVCFHFINTFCRYPGIHDVRVLTYCDPEGNTSLLDLNRQLFITPFEEVFILCFEFFEFFVVIIEFHIGLFDLSNNICISISSTDFFSIYWYLNLIEPNFGKSFQCGISTLIFHKNSDNATVFLRISRKNLSIFNLYRRSVVGSCTDKNGDILVSAVKIKSHFIQFR